MKFSRLALGALLSACLSSRAGAQEGSRLAAGTRIRVTAIAPGSEPFTGSVLRLVTDTLVMGTEGGTALLTFPASGIRALEVSDGRDRWHWGLTGAGVGAAALGIGTAATLRNEDPNGLAAFVGLIAGGVLGAAVGGVVGAIVAPEGWRPYPMPRSAGAVAP